MHNVSFTPSSLASTFRSAANDLFDYGDLDAANTALICSLRAEEIAEEVRADLYAHVDWDAMMRQATNAAELEWRRRSHRYRIWAFHPD